MQHIYFSGIGGSGINALAHIALDCGYKVSGSDLVLNSTTTELSQRGAQISSAPSYEEIQKCNHDLKIDWLVYTAALKADHPHLQFAKINNIKTSKRDEFINLIIEKFELKLIAIAGTHGKTTTTAMLTWLFKELDLPVSYLIGSQISFGRTGAYEKDSKYFVLECDEFDRNFLHYKPFVAPITTIEYDHPDTYSTPEKYRESFNEFLSQISYGVVTYSEYLQKAGLEESFSKIPTHISYQLKNINTDNLLNQIKLLGLHNRQNALLALTAYILAENLSKEKIAELIPKINTFPGTYRRFEKIAENVYSDYAHHPDEIRATLQMAREARS